MGLAMIAWNDVAASSVAGPADYFVVWRSQSPDTGFVEYATTTDTVWVDLAVPADVRVYYHVSSVRGYLMSSNSDWVSIRWLDYTGGAFNTTRLHAYYPGDPRVLLVVWPPNDTCDIAAWEYGIMDKIGIRCEESPFPAPSMSINSPMQ
jgi:hypothetical protein